MDITEISQKNQLFWDEICGSGIAKSLHIKDSNPDSLRKFDEWFFNYYPYLNNHIPFFKFHGKDVLEIGLGFGSVSQRIVETGSNYTGMDIAKGPVRIVNERINNIKGHGRVLTGNILTPPFVKESFDYIISIGCFHHTGDMEKSLNQCFHLLRPSGTLIFMVYNAFSYRRFKTAFIKTLLYWLKQLIGNRGSVKSFSPKEIGSYDRNFKGESAPYTEWVSIKSLKNLCSPFSGFIVTLENINTDFPLTIKSRERLLKTFWPELLGLDIYVTVEKQGV